MLKNPLVTIAATLLLLTIAAAGTKTNPARAKSFVVGGFQVEYAGGEAFFDFQGLMPGDRVAKALYVKNTTPETRELKLAAGNSSGSSPDPQKLTEALSLEIKRGDIYIYGGPGNEKKVKNLFVDPEHAVSLGQVAGNTEAWFDFNIEFDPNAHNEFNGLVSKFDLSFGNQLASFSTPAVLGAETSALGDVLGAETGGGWVSAVLGLAFLSLGLYLRRRSICKIPSPKFQ